MLSKDIANKDPRFIEGWMSRLVVEGVITPAEAAEAVAWCEAHPENWVTLRVAMGKDNKKVKDGYTGCNANGITLGSGDPKEWVRRGIASRK
jgi:hypothetical protein